MLGGTVLYISRKVVHTQYISASEEGKQSHALDALFQDLIKIRYKDLRLFRFRNIQWRRRKSAQCLHHLSERRFRRKRRGLRHLRMGIIICTTRTIKKGVNHVDSFYFITPYSYTEIPSLFAQKLFWYSVCSYCCFRQFGRFKSSCKKSYCGKQIQLKLCNIIVLVLFHRNLYRILTYFGDN